MIEVTSESYHLEGFINEWNRPVNFDQMGLDCREQLVGQVEDVFPNIRFPDKKKFYPYDSTKGLSIEYWYTTPNNLLHY